MAVAIGRHEPRPLADTLADLGQRDALPVQERDPEMPKAMNVAMSEQKIPKSTHQELALDGDDDFPACATLPEVPDRLGGLAQWERPVDNGRDLARLDELSQRLQILQPAP